MRKVESLTCVGNLFANFTMIPRRETISVPAHHAIVDGDDLHIDGSFEDEENFSTVGNLSCHTRQLSVGTLTRANFKKSHSTEKKNFDVDDDAKVGNKFYKKSRKVMKGLRHLGQSSRSLSLKMLHRPSLFRSSSNTVSDYEEVMENEFGPEEEDEFAHETGTVISVRSSRNNIRTGQSMLLRQQAVLFNRSPKTNSDWELSQMTHSSPNNQRNMMLRGKSLILDDSSIGGMSDITEDAPSFYGFTNLHHLSFRRAPMFINTNTYCIKEGEDEDEDEGQNRNDNEEIDCGSCEESLKRAYDFREISPSDDLVGRESTEISPIAQSPSGYENEGKRLSLQDRMRRRAYSDSDVESEIHKNDFNTNLQPNAIFSWNLKTMLKDQIHFQNGFYRRRSMSDDSCVNKSNGKDFEEGSPQKSSLINPSRFIAAAYSSWPFPKTRIRSDVDVDDTATRNEHQSSLIDDLSEGIEIQRAKPDVDEIPTKNELLSPSKEYSSEGIEIQNVDLDTKPELILSKRYDALILSKRYNASSSLETSSTSQSPRRQSLPMFESDELYNRSFLRSRTYSDSVIHERSTQEDILWDPRDHIDRDEATIMVSLTKYSGGATELFGSNESPIASKTRNPVPKALVDRHPSPSTEIVDHNHHHPATSSVLATLSDSNNHIASISVAIESQKPLQDSLFQMPSPRTSNAASMIVAALRPAPAKRLPTLPTQSCGAVARQSDQYYWGTTDAECSIDTENNDCRRDRSLELKELCSWSSQSFDDELF
mmetsp:Transcript_26031/g.61143  ORF Transcript_26031/g.61143 Transcript_26031/m.61143 type:complete len:766 (+) Transcript_26031:110-2407(+)